MTYEPQLNIAYFLLNNKVYQFKEFIELKVIKDEEGYFVTSEKYDIFGMGDTIFEAKEDAREELCRRYEWKFDNENPIPTEVISWLELVDSNLEQPVC